MDNKLELFDKTIRELVVLVEDKSHWKDNEHLWKKIYQDYYSNVDLKLKVEKSWFEKVKICVDCEILIHTLKLTYNINGLYKLTNLDLGYKKLISIPKEIGQLTNLTQLILYDNHLTSIPKEIGHLTNLTKLGLSINQLTSIPKEISQLKNLTYLGLSDNQLTSIPQEIGQLSNLIYIELYNNPLIELPYELCNLKKLEKNYYNSIVNHKLYKKLNTTESCSTKINDNDEIIKKLQEIIEILQK